MHQRLQKQNQILAAFSPDEFARISPHLTSVSVPQNTVLIDSQDEIDQVYFPVTGTVALLEVTRDGKAIETATIGNSGVVGAMAGLGLTRSLVRCNAPQRLTTLRIATPIFRRLVTQHAFLRDMCIRQNELLLTNARITAACNALHSVEERFARLLLRASEHAESDTIELTQEQLSDMLGVRRTSITEVAGKLQTAGLISYSRGVIQIIGRDGLSRTSCECHITAQESGLRAMNDWHSD